MLINKSSIVYNQRRPAPSFVVLLLVLVYALFSSGCAGVNPLSDYNFSDATLVVDTRVAPTPLVVTQGGPEIINGIEGSPTSVFRAATAVVKETQAVKVRRRIKRAAQNVDVAGLVADGIMNRADRYLGFSAPPENTYPDLVLELEIKEHGLYAGPAYDGRTAFFLEAFVTLRDDLTGESLWDSEVDIVEPVSEHVLFSNVFKSKELADMSEADLEDALFRISDYTADYIVRALRSEITRAQR